MQAEKEALRAERLAQQQKEKADLEAAAAIAKVWECCRFLFSSSAQVGGRVSEAVYRVLVLSVVCVCHLFFVSFVEGVVFNVESI